MKDDGTGSGGPVNKTTKVGTENVGYTVVASVRMHSEGSEPGYEEDKMICLAVKKDTGELVCWERWHVESRGDNNGWSSGRYQPFRKGQGKTENCALSGFKQRIEDETDACISRTLGRQRKARELKPSIDPTIPED